MVLSFGEVLMDCLPDKNVIGGAPFNVVTHIKRLGESSGIISKIGTDELGSEIASFLKTEKIDQFVQKDSNYKTGYVTVKFIEGQPDYTIHSGCGWEFLDFENVATPKYFVFGSLALHFPKNKESFLKYKAAFKDAEFICDLNLRTPFYSKENIELCLSSTNILKINDEELDYLAAEYKVEDPIAWLKDKYGITKIILTKGSKGATVYWDDEEVSGDVTPVRAMRDTVGAGDSFTALFIYGLLKNVPLKENLKRASSFASLICEQSGAIPSDLSLYDSYKL
jgi:fructokinase